MNTISVQPPAKPLLIVVDEVGSMKFICDPAFADLMREGAATVRRASHIEPVNPVLRAVFHALRKLCGETGTVAQFTRSWRCLWRVNLTPSNGPTFGAYAKRQDALDAEVHWLYEHYLN